ncbi:MAG: response regulator [Rhodobacteraceae bacterium]|nr:response regulator [Paracoccaceae bacterium]
MQGLASLSAPVQGTGFSGALNLQRALALGALAALLAALALLPGLAGPGLQLVLLSGAGALLAATGMVAAVQALATRRRRTALNVLAAALAADAAPCVVTDLRAGRVLWVNDAAAHWRGLHAQDSMADWLSEWRAAPAQAVAHLLEQVAATGDATARLGIAAGTLCLDLRHVRPDLVVWRLAPHGMNPVAEDEIGMSPALDRLPVGLMRIGHDGGIASLNLEARRLLGLRDGECPDLADLLDGPGRPVDDWIAEAVSGRSANRTEILRAKREAVSDFLQVTLRRIDAAEGPRLYAVLSDATEFKALEDKFTQSQKMHAVGQLAGGIAHDFNNLLTAISGYCDLLLLRHDSGDPDYPDLIQIRQNANRAAGLVRQLLAFSRKQHQEPEVLDLGDTLRDLAHLLNRLLGERVTLTLAHGDDVPPIRADRRQMEQVLINLVVNARDAMPLGGEIRIETRPLVLVQETRRGKARIPPGTYALIEIRDEGVGIPADRLPRIFEPFYTTKRPGEGTGLGLSTVYGIMKQSGGFIFADSVEGQGTTFTLYFAACDPVQAAADTAPADPPALPPVRRDTGTILLVEDEVPVRAFTARALEMHGHAVIEAESGEAALELLADPSLHVDLLLSDVVLPGLDGPAWVDAARRDRPDVGVIFISGHVEDHLPLSGMSVPNAVFLGKPYTLQELNALVSEKLG